MRGRLFVLADLLNLNDEAKSAVYFVADFKYCLGRRQRHRDDHRAMASARTDGFT